MILHINRKNPRDLRCYAPFGEPRRGWTFEEVKSEDVSSTIALETIDLSKISISQTPRPFAPLVTGMERVKKLRDMHSGSLLDAQVFGALVGPICKSYESGASFTALDHLKKYNGGNDLGPIFTFDGTVFYMLDDDERATYVLGIRYIKSEGSFCILQPMMCNIRSVEQQQNVFSLVYEPSVQNFLVQ